MFLRLARIKPEDTDASHTITLDDLATFTFEKDRLNLFVRKSIGFGK